MSVNIQILRNNTISTSRSDAKTALLTQLAKCKDGEIAINRYQDGTQVKVLLGFNNTNGSGTGQFVFDADAIPADVQTKLDEITGDSGLIKQLIASAKSEIIGSSSDTKDKTTIYGSKAYTDAKIGDLDVADSLTKGSFVTAVSETDGKISVSRAAIASKNKTVSFTQGDDGSLDLAVNIDGTTIVKDANGKISVPSSAMTEYVGSNAINVSEVSDGKKTVSLVINSNDKVLSQGESGLLSSLSIAYDSTNRKIQLKGKDDKAISEFDATAFVKDGMLVDAQVFTATDKSQIVTFDDKTTYTYSGLTKGNHYVAFEFNTTGGASTEYKYDILDATSIIDVYTGGYGLELADHKFSVKLNDKCEEFLSVDSDGILLSGVQTAINSAAAKSAAEVAVKANDAHLKVTKTTAADNHTVYTLESVDTASADALTSEIAARKSVDGQSGQTYSANTSTNYIKDATSLNNADVKLDSALKTEETRATTAETNIKTGVGLADDGSHVKTSGNYTSDATSIAGEIAALDKALGETDASIQQLDMTAVGGDGKYISKVSQTNGLVSATASDLTTSAVSRTATSETTSKVAVTGTTAEAAIESLATSIKTNETAITNLNANAVKNIVVNGVSGTVAQNTASVTVAGDKMSTSDNFSGVEYPEPFNQTVTENGCYVEGNMTMDTAFENIETQISLLVSEILDNETTVSTSINKVAKAAGTLLSDGSIGYNQYTSGYVISGAESIHEATILLDEKLETLDDNVLLSVSALDNSVVVGTKDTSGDQQIGVQLSNTTTNLLTLQTDGLFVNPVLDCGTY